MTYLQLLQHLHQGIRLAMPLLLTRYQSPDFREAPAENDEVLMTQMNRIRDCSQRIEQIQRQLRDGEIRETDEAGPA